MPSDDLAERLRALRKRDAAAKVAKTAHIVAPSQQPAAVPLAANKAIKRNDVDELIARTRDEANVAREQGELPGGEGEDTALGLSSSPAPGSLDVDVGAEGKAFRSMAQQASSDAVAALKDHRQIIKESTDKAAVHSNAAEERLVLEAKVRPVLVRPTSSYQGEVSEGEDDDITSELADAMGDFGAEGPGAKESSPAILSPSSPQPLREPRPVVHKPQLPADTQSTNGAPGKDDEDGIEAEVQDLLARFTALRPSASRSASAASTASSKMPQPAAQAADNDDTNEHRFTGLLFPSAPSTTLTSPPTDSTAPAAAPHPTLGPSHSDIPSDRDLSPFHRLISKDLNLAQRLASGTSSSGNGEPLFPSAPQSALDNTADEIFCSICTSDASLTCSCPGDEYEGCAGDAYCSGCWVEAHAGMGREELRDHRTRDVIAKGRGGRRGGRGGPPRRRAMAA